MPNIEQLFTEISPTYDKVNHWMSLGMDLRWRKKSIAMLPWPATAEIRVLDLCAGTLDFSLKLSERYPRAKIDAVDFSTEMLRRGEAKIPPVHASNFTLHCADALALPFSDQQFDLVLCAYGMRNIPDQAKALTEIKRVLKVGGYVGILEFFKPTNWFSKFFYTTYGNVILPKGGGWISKREAAYRYLMSSIAQYTTLADFTTFLKNYRFKITKSQDFMRGISSFILGIKQ